MKDLAALVSSNSRQFAMELVIFMIFILSTLLSPKRQKRNFAPYSAMVLITLHIETLTLYWTIL